MGWAHTAACILFSGYRNDGRPSGLHPVYRGVAKESQRLENPSILDTYTQLCTLSPMWGSIWLTIMIMYSIVAHNTQNQTLGWGGGWGGAEACYSLRREEGSAGVTTPAPRGEGGNPGACQGCGPLRRQHHLSDGSGIISSESCSSSSVRARLVVNCTRLRLYLFLHFWVAVWTKADISMYIKLDWSVALRPQKP